MNKKSMYYQNIMTSLGEYAINYDNEHQSSLIIKGLTEKEKEVLKKLCINILNSLNNG